MSNKDTKKCSRLNLDNWIDLNRDSKSKTLMIIGCSKGKLTYKEKVRNFYTGQQFRMLKKLAERFLW